MISDHPIVDVARVRRGPIEKSRNGTTAYAWAVLALVCGHEIPYPRLRSTTRRPPRRVRCPECRS